MRGNDEPLGQAAAERLRSASAGVALRTSRPASRSGSACRASAVPYEPTPLSTRRVCRPGRAAARTARAAAARVAEQCDIGLGADKRGERPKRSPKRTAASRTDTASAPVTLRTAAGLSQSRTRGENGVRVALPDRVHTRHRDVDGLAAVDLLGDVEQDAVAKIRGVVQPREQDARAVPGRHELEDPLPAEAGLSVLADGCRRSSLVGSTARNRHERIHVAGREGDDARRLKALRNDRRQVAVERPR